MFSCCASPELLYLFQSLFFFTFIPFLFLVHPLLFFYLIYLLYFSFFECLALPLSSFSYSAIIFAHIFPPFSSHLNISYCLIPPPIFFSSYLPILFLVFLFFSFFLLSPPSHTLFLFFPLASSQSFVFLPLFGLSRVFPFLCLILYPFILFIFLL